MATVQRRPHLYAGSRIPSPIPTVLQVDPAQHDLDDVLSGFKLTVGAMFEALAPEWVEDESDHQAAPAE